MVKFPSERRTKPFKNVDEFIKFIQPTIDKFSITFINHLKNPELEITPQQKEMLIKNFEDIYEAFFLGAYTQYFKQTGKRSYAMPFVMGKVKGNIFQGLIKEFDSSAHFEGKFDKGKSIRFTKHYLEGMIDHDMNILYEGDFQEKNNLYIGTWRFDGESPGDLKKSGRFFLKEI